MKCPIDDADLVMAERQGIEIDYCPKCRGVWLDRGELDKIIDRSTDDDDDRRRQASSRQPDPPRYRDDREYQTHRPYKKKKSLLGELFDF
ncbi:TFIIB-type zinc ribbon-containing protein [Aquamicrobium soli]|uniref:Zf-TFIIB domain-containing protein n=1 Tax=Aquamicrobium soli TaxID=1811518 RepID=A0ABV7KET5_9HYPH